MLMQIPMVAPNMPHVYAPTPGVTPNAPIATIAHTAGANVNLGCTACTRGAGPMGALGEPMIATFPTWARVLAVTAFVGVIVASTLVLRSIFAAR